MEWTMRVGVIVVIMLGAMGVARAETLQAGTLQAGTGREALVPAGATRVLRVQAAGVQLYECVAADGGATWRFREPLATLMVDGTTVGRHFAGPAWEMTDGSLVRGRVVAEAPGESGRDIPWLRLAVVGRSGRGVLGTVTGVARLETRGGVFGGACAAIGALHSEPYSAAYLFLGGE